MKKIKATCKTEKCSQKDITHEFVSDIEETMCGLCGEKITDLIIEELENGTTEESK